MFYAQSTGAVISGRVFCIKQATISAEVPDSLMATPTLVTLRILFWCLPPFRWLTIFGAHVLYGPHSPELNRRSVKTVQQGKEWTEGPARIIIANFSFSLHKKDINVQNNQDTSKGWRSPQINHEGLVTWLTRYFTDISTLQVYCH